MSTFRSCCPGCSNPPMPTPAPVAEFTAADLCGRHIDAVIRWTDGPNRQQVTRLESVKHRMHNVFLNDVYSIRPDTPVSVQDGEAR